jgi:hypothetical protein
MHLHTTTSRRFVLLLGAPGWDGMEQTGLGVPTTVHVCNFPRSISMKFVILFFTSFFYSFFYGWIYYFLCSKVVGGPPFFFCFFVLRYTGWRALVGVLFFFLLVIFFSGFVRWMIRRVGGGRQRCDIDRCDL